MDAILLNPGTQVGDLTPEQQKEAADLRARLKELEGIKRSPINLPIATKEAVLNRVEGALANPDGSVLVFFPSQSDGQRAVMLGLEQVKSPSRGPGRFTIHKLQQTRSGIYHNTGASFQITSKGLEIGDYSAPPFKGQIEG